MADAPEAGLRVPLPQRHGLKVQLGGSFARALDWFEGCAGSIAQQSGDALRGLTGSPSDATDAKEADWTVEYLGVTDLRAKMVSAMTAAAAAERDFAAEEARAEPLRVELRVGGAHGSEGAEVDADQGAEPTAEERSGLPTADDAMEVWSSSCDDERDRDSGEECWGSSEESASSSGDGWGSSSDEGARAAGGRRAARQRVITLGLGASRASHAVAAAAGSYGVSLVRVDASAAEAPCAEAEAEPTADGGGRRLAGRAEALHGAVEADVMEWIDGLESDVEEMAEEEAEAARRLEAAAAQVADWGGAEPDGASAAITDAVGGAPSTPDRPAADRPPENGSATISANISGLMPSVTTDDDGNAQLRLLRVGGYALQFELDAPATEQRPRARPTSQQPQPSSSSPPPRPSPPTPPRQLFPTSRPAASHAALRQMGARELLTTLREHGVSTAGCLDKRDLIALATQAFSDSDDAATL